MLDFSAIKKSKPVVRCIDELSQFLKGKKFDTIQEKVAELEEVIYSAYTRNKRSKTILMGIKDPEIKEMIISEQAYYDSQSIYESIFSAEIGDTVVTSKDMKKIYFTGKRVAAMNYWAKHMKKNLSVYELHGIDEHGNDVEFERLVIG